MRPFDNTMSHTHKIRKKCNLYVEAAALFASDDRIKAFVKIFRMLILAFDVIVDSSAHNIFCTIFHFYPTVNTMSSVSTFPILAFIYRLC